MNFESNGFNKIRICNTFHCQDVISQLPEPLQTNKNIHVPTVKFQKTIRNKMLQYKDTAQAIVVIFHDEVSLINNTFHCKL